MTRRVLVVVCGLALSLGCGGGADAPVADASASAQAAAPAAAHADQPGWTGTVVETMDAGTYTYVKVDTGSEEIWAAAPKLDVAVGQSVHVPPGAPMKDFHSDSMDRDFPLIYFVSGIMPADAALAAGGGSMPMGHPVVGSGAATESEVDVSGVQALDGGVTVAQIHADAASLGGQTVALRGKVVKVNEQIMGRNWLHIQDGTGDVSAGTNDITVTSSGIADVGDTVVVRGTLTLDKDFGAGYRYAVIVEDAQVSIE